MLALLSCRVIPLSRSSFVPVSTSANAPRGLAGTANFAKGVLRTSVSQPEKGVRVSYFFDQLANLVCYSVAFVI